MITFRKQGNFYSVFDDDAIILHSLFNYKIKDSRVGFPISSIDKIESKLKELHVDYKLNDTITHFDDNNYDNNIVSWVYCDNPISIDRKSVV